MNMHIYNLFYFPSSSIMTKKSSKSRRKQKLKKYRLKEGSPDEDLAHIAALCETVVKIDTLKGKYCSFIILYTFLKLVYDYQFSVIHFIK